VLGSAANIDILAQAYNAALKVSNRTEFNGQRFTLAPQATANGADTAYATHQVTFGVMKYSNSDEPHGFLPTINEANIIEPSYQRFTGISKPVPVSLVDDNNAGSVFAKFNFSQGLSFAGFADKTGGLATPNFNLSGLSKAAGAFGGDIEKFKSAMASANDFFNVSSLPDPKLFGVFKLSDLLDFFTGDKSSYDLSKPLLDRVPKIPNLVTSILLRNLLPLMSSNRGLKILTWALPALQKSRIRFSDTNTGKTKKSGAAYYTIFYGCMGQKL
jgi:hypothetical protein